MHSMLLALSCRPDGPRSLPRGLLAFALACTVGIVGDGQAAAVKGEVKLITLDPGHFHAALFQREMLPGVSDQVQVYAPLGPDLTAHMNRIALFNERKEDPTNWKLEIHSSPDFFERLLREHQGNVVVISGKNRVKIERIGAIARAGFHVLADKPWIIEPDALDKLQNALDMADRKGVVAFDAMTERYEISCIVQRALVNEREVFGTPLTGSPDDPAVSMESTHYLLKEVAGVPNLRPAWFFDIRQQGEGLSDVGTHLVERVPWMLFPEQGIDCQRDIQVLRASRWPTLLTRAQFRRVTGEGEFPEYLKSALNADRLEYFANNSVNYTLRGIHTKLVIRWNFEAQPGAKDTHQVICRGSRSRIEVRQGVDEQFRPEVYVVPNRAEEKDTLLSALDWKIREMQRSYPGLAVQEQPGRFRVVIPDVYRVSHEAHFAKVAQRFLDYVWNPKLLPAWEKPNMLAKYYVTTKGIEIARRATATSPKP